MKFFFEKKINSGVKEVLYLGGENELKGWNIIKKLMNTDIKLNYHIAGYVNEENKVIGDNIKYYQVVDNVDFLYEMADVIVLPSTYPHQLMPIFEAGIYKVPVITSDFPLAHEHIKNNFNGILVPPNNVDAIIQAILTLDNNYDKKIFMIENNFLTSQCHTYQSVKNRLLEMFNKL